MELCGKALSSSYSEFLTAVYILSLGTVFLFPYLIHIYSFPDHSWCCSAPMHLGKKPGLIIFIIYFRYWKFDTMCSKAFSRLNNPSVFSLSSEDVCSSWSCLCGLLLNLLLLTFHNVDPKADLVVQTPEKWIVHEAGQLLPSVHWPFFHFQRLGSCWLSLLPAAGLIQDLQLGCRGAAPQ